MIAIVVAALLAVAGWVWAPIGSIEWVLAELPAVVLVGAVLLDRVATPAGPRTLRTPRAGPAPAAARVSRTAPAAPSVAPTAATTAAPAAAVLPPGVVSLDAHRARRAGRGAA